eukprot:1153763-Pelagomonas_calceolata.AAC.2
MEFFIQKKPGSLANAGPILVSAYQKCSHCNCPRKGRDPCLAQSVNHTHAHILAQVVSQLARVNKESFNTYEPISRATIYPHVRKLLAHPDPGVRARVCNLLGNMCRHSAFFYRWACERVSVLSFCLACLQVGVWACERVYHSAFGPQVLPVCIPLKDWFQGSLGQRCTGLQQFGGACKRWCQHACNFVATTCIVAAACDPALQCTGPARAGGAFDRAVPGRRQVDTQVCVRTWPQAMQVSEETCSGSAGHGRGLACPSPV